MSEQPKSSTTAVSAAETRRLESLKKCVIEFNIRRGEIAGIRRISQLVRVWPVSASTRTVMPDKSFNSYASGISESQLIYFISRPNDEPHAVVELLADDGKALARFLVTTVVAEPAIRGMYAVRTSIKTTVPSNPEGVVFNKGYFQ